MNKFTKIQKFNILNQSLKEYINIINECIKNSRCYIDCLDYTNTMICELYKIKNKKNSTPNELQNIIIKIVHLMSRNQMFINKKIELIYQLENLNYNIENSNQNIEVNDKWIELLDINNENLEQILKEKEDENNQLIEQRRRLDSNLNLQNKTTSYYNNLMIDSFNKVLFNNQEMTID